ncbi:MAG: tail fiber domain-containing protein [Flavobacteriales bacterium]|nr:tail fiber domain-containing protein [Flavobacteriales bacterium]MCB9166763.1 tail fiber domain-containing protein [Flavobacteriales bacterium]
MQQGRLLLFVIGTAAALPLTAQNIGINANGAAPDPSALLDIDAAALPATGKRGLLIPRMTTSERVAITSPANGLMVYDTTTGAFWYFDGAQWVQLVAGADNDWMKTTTTIYNNTDSIAIGRATAYTDLHMASNKNLLIGDSLSGTGFKMIYYANKGAFRCGYLTSPFGGYNYDRFWDYDSVGYYSWAGGQNSMAKGFGSFAFGSFGWANGSSSVAFFGNAKGNNSYTFGGYSKGHGSFTVEGTAEDDGGIAMYGYAGGRYGVAIGGGTTGLGASSSREDYAVAIGWNADARGQASIALGPSDAFGYNAFATGWVTEARGNYSQSFGYRTVAYPMGSMALGRYNVITGDSALWIGSDPVFQIGDGTSTTNRSNSFTVLKNGHTAVGLDYPTGMLQVSTALGSLGTTVNTANAAVLIGTSTSGMAFDGNQIETVGDMLYLNFGSAEHVVTNVGGGDLGVGTTTPDRRVDVEGSNEQYVRVTSTGGTRTAGVELKRTGTGFSDWQIRNQSGLLWIGQSNDDLATVTDVLRLGGSSVTPASDNAITLGLSTLRWTSVYAVNGTINTSDARDKTDVRDLEAGLEAVLRLHPVRYRWKDRPSDGDKFGLIAQELREVLPEVVVEGAGGPAPEEGTFDPGEGRLGVYYSDLIPVLIRSIQEQDAMIRDLRARIARLEQR